MDGDRPDDYRHVYPLDPLDGRVDTALMSPAVDPAPRQPAAWERPLPVTPYAVDLMECLCGAHIWIRQDGGRFEHGGFPHRCEPPTSNLSALADDIAIGMDRSVKAEERPDDTQTATGTSDPLAGL